MVDFGSSIASHQAATDAEIAGVLSRLSTVGGDTSEISSKYRDVARGKLPRRLELVRRISAWV